MVADANVGRWRVRLGDGQSPEGFDDACAFYDVSGLGVTRSQVEVTTYCSDGSREYKSGLKEGNEVTLTANYVSSDTQLRALQVEADAPNGTTRNIQIVDIMDSPEVIYQFAMTLTGWNLTPPVDDRATMTITGKISGPITRSDVT